MKKKITKKKSAKKTKTAKKGGKPVKKAAKKSAGKKTKKAKSAKKSTAARKSKSKTKSTAKRVPMKMKKTARKTPPKTTIPATDLETLMTGASAPSFELPTDAGTKVSLGDFKGKTVILYFYPKDDTPGCTQESCDFRDSFSRVQAKGAIVLGVSKDSVTSHQKFKEKFGLPFQLVSDEAGKMLEAYRVWKEKSMYGKKFMGIDRTTYLIDVDANGKGIIRKAYPKVKVEGHVDEILKDLG